VRGWGLGGGRRGCMLRGAGSWQQGRELCCCFPCRGLQAHVSQHVHAWRPLEAFAPCFQVAYVLLFCVTAMAGSAADAGAANRDPQRMRSQPKRLTPGRCGTVVGPLPSCMIPTATGPCLQCCCGPSLSRSFAGSCARR